MDIKNLIKIPILILAFTVSLIAFSGRTRVGGTDYKGSMEEASLPVVDFFYQDLDLARLYGYKQEMDISTERGSIVPLDADMALNLRIDTCGSRINSAAYQIRSLDGEDFLCQGDISLEDESLEKEGEGLSGNRIFSQIDCPNILEENREYALVITLDMGDEPVYYYCRIEYGSDNYLDECLDFAEQFHRYTFTPDKIDNLSVYLEPNGEDNESLSHVTINSSLTQLGWADFTPEIVGDVIYNFCELTEYYNIITVDYTVMEADEAGSVAYYNVEEYYRVRYGADVGRCYLLDFERNMNEIFDTAGELFDDDGLILGIGNDDVPYIKSVTGRTICFVSQGDLWTYNADTELLTRVFSFRSIEGFDTRENHNGYDIVPLRLEEGGDVVFAVYGYMNRGVHEGQVGISYCRYDALTGMVTEEMFIPLSLSEELVKREINGNIYLNIDGISYLALDGSIYRINLSDMTSSVVESGIDYTNLFFSSEAAKMVYQVEEGDVIYVLDMDDETTSEYKPKDGQNYEGIGFLDVDFIYAIKNSDTPYTQEGIRPFAGLDIIGNAEKRVIKQYSKDKIYIKDITIDDYMVNLECLKLSNGAYRETDPDTIVNEQGQNLITSSISYENMGEKQRVTVLDTDDTPSGDDISIIFSSEEILENIPYHSLRNSPLPAFIVYDRGECGMVTDNLSKAMEYANATSALVVAGTDKVWSRGKDTSFYVEDTAAFTGLKDIEALYTLSETGLDMVLGFLPRGYLVGFESEGQVKYISGYDSTYVYFYDAKSDCTEKVESEQAVKMCAADGNKFYIFTSDAE